MSKKEDGSSCCASNNKCHSIWPCFICNAMQTYVHWLLRLSFAAVFIYRGVPKLIDPATIAQMLGISTSLMLFIGVCEVVAGAFVIIGGVRRCNAIFDTITRIGALLTVPILGYAITRVHWGQWSFMVSETHPAGGIEFQTILLVVALYFLSRGNKV